MKQPKGSSCVEIGRASIRCYCLCAFLTLLILAASAPAAHPFQAGIAWDAAAGSNVAGYKVYYGTSSRDYTSVVNAGAQTSVTLTNLTDGETYYVAAKTYDSNGNQSDYSTELVLHNVNASAGQGGTISPDGSVAVTDRGSQIFTFTPDSGFYVTNVTVDGASVGSPKTYTFYKVTASHTIQAFFSRTAPAGASTAPSPSTGSTTTGGTGTSSPADPASPSGPATAGGSSPVADAGPDQQVREGSRVSLVGSNSTGTQKTIASYSWTQTGGTRIALSNANSAIARFTAPDVSSQGAALTFKLVVTDPSGRQSAATCIVNVVVDDHPPYANTGADQQTTAWSIVTLDASRSYDPDDGIASYLWTQISGPPVNIHNASSTHATFIAPHVEPNGASLVFRLTVTDHAGLKATDTCLVNVLHSSPLAVKANAGRDITAMEGCLTRLDGSYSTSIWGNKATFRWHQTAGPPVVLSDPTAIRPSFMAPLIRPGDSASLSFTLTLTDPNNLKSSDECTVRVVTHGLTKR